MSLAPIGMSVYTRLNHFRQAIEALKKNVLADQSQLFIYSDAASKIEDEPLVKAVREFAHSISGFDSVNVIERERNYGGRQNSWQAWIAVSNIRPDGRAIYLEDDIVTAPGFLSFMNEALEFYAGDEQVMGISGYSPPLAIPDDYPWDLFILPRPSGWGMGSYNRTVEMASTKIDAVEFNAIRDKSIFNKAGHDVLEKIELEVGGQLDAGDVRCMYHQALHDKYTIYPVHSLTQNIGLDGSGVHCAATDKFHHDRLWEKTGGFSFIKEVVLDSRIVAANRKFRQLSLSHRLKGFIRRYVPQASLTSKNNRH